MKSEREYRSRIAGLVFSSPFPLPGFRVSGWGKPVDVQVCRAPAPLRLERPTAAGELFQATEDEWLFRLPEGGRLLVRNGSEIIYDGAAPAAVLGEALQPLVAVILQQRGVVSLHASAVRFGSSGAAFLGRSGAGKSTLAGWFAARGYRVLTDDLCPLVLGQRPCVGAAFPDLKLDPALARRFGFDTRRARELPNADRARLALRLVRQSRRPTPLEWVFVLRPREAERLPRLRRLSPPEALRALLTQTYRAAYFAGRAGRARRFTACASVAKHARVIEVRYRQEPGLLRHLGVAVRRECEAPTTGP